MKITRHCHHELEKQLDPHVNGVLLGLINENKHVLEVTHCFPLMNSDTDEGMEISMLGFCRLFLLKTTSKQFRALCLFSS